jgi:hypothetical protein
MFHEPPATVALLFQNRPSAIHKPAKGCPEFNGQTKELADAGSGGTAMRGDN